MMENLVAELKKRVLFKDTTAASDKLPDTKLQPYVYASANGSSSGGNVLYVECYNT